jgi:hypothetical protein
MTNPFHWEKSNIRPPYNHQEQFRFPRTMLPVAHSTQVKNAQVITDLQTSCYNSVHKLSTSCVWHCLFPVFDKSGTSCYHLVTRSVRPTDSQQVDNNKFVATCYEQPVLVLLEQLLASLLLSSTLQQGDNNLIRTCHNNWEQAVRAYILMILAWQQHCCMSVTASAILCVQAKPDCLRSTKVCLLYQNIGQTNCKHSWRGIFCSILWHFAFVLEPTNMLDLNAIIWLENYLQVRQYTCLTLSI